jgi:hypothetical protein
MGRACGTYGRQERYTGFWWRYLRERDYLENLDMGGNVIVEWIFKKWGGGHGLD